VLVVVVPFMRFLVAMGLADRLALTYPVEC